MLEFRKIEIEDAELFNSFIKLNTERSCENTFVNLFMWRDCYNNMIAVENDTLFIKSGSGDRQSFALPIGGDIKSGVEKIKEYSGEKPVFWLQDCDRFEEFKEIYKNEYTLEEIRKNFDYIYLTENLATLKGKKYHSKRNHINSFSKKYEWRYETVTSQNIDAVKLCAEKWYAEKQDKMDRHMICEKKGLYVILDNFEKLNIKAGAIFVGDEVVAFTMGSHINDEIYNIHTEKALEEYAEAYSVINREFAKNELSDYKYINREDDMGLEGLRKAKLSYYPDIILKKYIAR